MERPQTPKGGVMRKVKQILRERRAKVGLPLPEKYRDVRDLRWSDSLEREIFELRSRLG